MTHTTTARVVAPRAKLIGLIVTAVGVVVLNITPYLTWVSRPDPAGGVDHRVDVNGYELDSLIPFVAYLGIGLLVALVYAVWRADRNQHRGLTLASMGVGLATTILCLAYVITPPGELERGFDLHIKYGAWIALLAALIWTVGSGLLAREVEGDDYAVIDPVVPVAPTTTVPGPIQSPATGPGYVP